MNIPLTVSSLAVAALFFACTSGDAQPDSTPVDGAATVDATDDSVPDDVSQSDAFMTADHNPLPVIMSRGGPTMTSVRLVVITYADTPNAAALTTFANWIGTSDWLATVGQDYGVGPGSVLGAVALPGDAPDSVTSTDIEAMIGAGIMDGTFPSPTDHDYSNVLYMVFYPEHTTIHEVFLGEASGTSCMQFTAYHSETQQGALHLTYAAIADCGASGSHTELAGQTSEVSHEYIEAATDPYPLTAPAYEIQDDGSSSWGFLGGEVADLCALGNDLYTDEGHVVQRVWSNSAAEADHDPCLPASTTTGPYFNVSALPFDAQFASAGDTVTFMLTGWSLAPVPDWTIDVFEEGGDLMLTASTAPMTLNNGVAAIVTVNLPPGTPSGYANFIVSSTGTGTGRPREVWLLTVVVE